MSNSDQGDGEEIVLGQSSDEDNSDDDFQILIDESISYDEMFLSNNMALIKELTF